MKSKSSLECSQAFQLMTYVGIEPYGISSVLYQHLRNII